MMDIYPWEEISVRPFAYWSAEKLVVLREELLDYLVNATIGVGTVEGIVKEVVHISQELLIRQRARLGDRETMRFIVNQFVEEDRVYFVNAKDIGIFRSGRTNGI